MYRIISHLTNAFDSLVWIIYSYKKFKDHIINPETEYSYIRIYKFYLWNRNAKYFLVKREDGETLFLKLYDLELLEREIFILNKIRSNNPEMLVPKVYESGNFFAYGYVVLEYFSFSSLNNIKNYNVDSDKLYNALYKILLVLKKHEIIHRDFRPHNILYSQAEHRDDSSFEDFGNEIVIIDFSSSIIKSDPIHSKELLDNSQLETLGDKYRWSCGWDDSYSIYKILKEYGASRKQLDEISNHFNQLNILS